jgi:epoxyqueuosine reductase
LTSDTVKRIAQECGFELAGVAAAEPPCDFERYQSWVDQGHAGAMGYLADRRAEMRRDVRKLLPSAKTVVCVGKLYQSAAAPAPEGHGIVSRYASGGDYHQRMNTGLEQMAARLQEIEACEWKACVDTAPVLERTYARLAGLGWVGKNTCLINEQRGSWFFLGELITSLELTPDLPPPERCGTCTRCIDACPTDAFVPAGDWWAIDARRCIAYLTIELHGPIPDEYRDAMGTHIFGCDICQDVCPWNSRHDAGAGGLPFALDLEECSNLSEPEFRLKFEGSALARPKHPGFLRNVAVAMGNSGLKRFEQPLERLAAGENEMVAEHARWALRKVRQVTPCED